jgi:two-component system, cell cycle sensor histidine kinase and response regulator CckA
MEPSRRERLTEAQRLAALKALDILDTSPEPVFEAMVDVAVRTFDVPIAVVTFIDSSRQWFKARRGLDVLETARDVAFCAHVVQTCKAMIVEDASTDVRFAHNPLVTGAPLLRFYAGAPLTLRSGACVGSFAIMDHAPRAFDALSRAHLQKLADVVVDAIEQRVVTAEARQNVSRTQARSMLESARQRAIFDAALDAIVLADSHGDIVEMNPAAERIFGLSRRDAIGRGVTDLIVPPAMRAAHDAAFQRYLATGEARVLGRRLELSALDVTGREFPVELTVIRLPEEPPMFAAFLRDLTERKQLEAQLLHSQKMEAVGRLAGGIAHDFNNLLSVILSYAELLAGDFAPSDPRRGDVDEIVRATQRAAELTQQLLAFGRKRRLERKILLVDELLRRTANLLVPLLGSGIRVTWNLGAAAARVSADPGSIEQVIMNLALNARDAMRDVGELVVTTAVVTIDAHGTLGVEKGSYVQLSVRDTGCGMDAATRARIFEPFFTTKDEKGNGLGLATVLGIVEQSGGAVRVASEVGQGTTFDVYLPVVDGPMTEAPAPLSAADDARGHETILLVEDEPALRAVVATILRRQGYEVLVAPGGVEAVDVAANAAGPVDLLLTDIVMPKMNGVELAELLVRARPTLRVVCMSGFAEESMIRRVHERGYGFLQKPFNPETLSRYVRDVLDRAGRAQRVGD